MSSGWSSGIITYVASLCYCYIRQLSKTKVTDIYMRCLLVLFMLSRSLDLMDFDHTTIIEVNITVIIIIQYAV